MEYEEPLITCDRVLELFTKERPAGITHGEINTSLGYKNGDPDSSFVLAALDKLTTENYLLKYGDGNSYFKISGDTFTFKRNGGYRGLVEREKRKAELKEAFDELGLKSTQSVIDTNTSIQTLNKQTATFYEKQTSFNNWQKGLTIAIGFFTLVQVLIAIFKKDSKMEIIQMPSIKELELNLNQLKSKIEAKASLDSLFHQQVKDSLKSISERTR